MLGWFFKKKETEYSKKTEKAFGAVKRDMDAVGKWLKHLDGRDKQLFDSINEVKREISSLRDEIESLREGVDLSIEQPENEQVFKKLPVWDKQTTVEDVQEAVQTPVQTGNLYDILKDLSANERLLIFTLMNSDMKLSYEDLAMLLGKERATVRGQINAIKQKSEGLLEEIIEKNGKKRVFVPDQIKEKLAKYAKVRVSKPKKDKKKEQIEEKSEI